ncbi:MAG: isoprenylcysteine carboxylmethyltransferase family protein [Pseudomonadota bacterium]
MASDPKNRSPFDIPPLYFALALLSMYLLHRWLPIIDVIDPPLSWLGWLLIAGGIGLAVWAERLFSRVGTGVRPFTPSTSLVATGPYRFTRNPMYLGMMLVPLGGFLLAGSIGSFLVIPVFFWWIHQRFVLPEETHMTEHFGDAYEDFKQKTRRWL